LSDCQFGECVRQSTIDSAVAETSGGGNGLSGGVIAGLAVLGAIVLLLALLLFFGWLRQRKARKVAGGPGAAAGEAKLLWKDVGYSLPSTDRPISFLRSKLHFDGQTPFGSSDDGKLVLVSVSGSVSPGSLLAILGPSGAGKSTLVDILAGKRKIGRTYGTVELVPTESGAVVTVGYVDQNDVLPSTASMHIVVPFETKTVVTEFFILQPCERPYSLLPI
jgi:hypothetical protein